MSESCTGVILAGGAASRYGGRPKGLVRIGGRRVIDRVAEALSACTDELLVIANDPAAVDWLPVVRTEADIRPGNGSLGGIHAALWHARTPIVLVAWDMPFVPAALLAALRARGTDADVVAPSSESRRGLEPLCAWYHPSCLPAIEARLDAGDRRVVAFYDAVRVERLAPDEVARFGDPARLFLNINTPEDLERAERDAAASAGGRGRPQA
ncbi:MAG TPA: molybdenum cofactor guanylyltransferase [Gemmatimonadaceae bacterium]|nr:molybdenum cofactor guanylyltransferase [Gemmatimonadaceae bacterium]